MLKSRIDEHEANVSQRLDLLEGTAIRHAAQITTEHSALGEGVRPAIDERHALSEVTAETRHQTSNALVRQSFAKAESAADVRQDELIKIMNHILSKMPQRISAPALTVFEDAAGHVYQIDTQLLQTWRVSQLCS